MSKLNVWRIWSALALAVIVSMTAHAQVNTAGITGTITDSSHSVVAGAQITIVNENTGLAKSGVADGRGEFHIDFLPVGTYSVTVAASGFQKLQRKGLALVAGQVLSLQLQLQVGSISQTVTVSGGASAINTETSNQLSTVSSVEVSQLPLANLQWTGAVAGVGTGITLIPYSAPNVAIPNTSGMENISMNGITGNSMSVTLDGTNASGSARGPGIGDYYHPNIIDTVAIDAVQESSMNKGLLPASVGGTISGNINLISKGGTNQFHGDAFEVNDVSAYNARNQFLTSKPGSRLNLFGGSVGGPILKDKLFFFGSFEGARSDTTQVINTTIPTPYLESISPAAYKPFWAIWPSCTLAPSSPTATSCRYTAPVAVINNDLNTTDRVDYNISPSNQLSVRFVYAQPYKSTPSVVANNPQVFHVDHTLVNVSFLHSHANWTSSSRFATNKEYNDRTDQGINQNPQIEGIGVSGIFGLGNPEDSGAHGYYWTGMEDFEIVHGRHDIQFGGIVQRQNLTAYDYNTADFSYSTLADFLANTPTNLEVTYPLPPLPAYFYQIGSYVQDNFKATSSLTFNLGLRYDLYTVVHQPNGYIWNRGIDPTRAYLGQGYGPYLPPSQVYNGDHNNFQPRVGFAWALGASRKTVIRGAGGILVGPTDWFDGVLNDVSSPGLPFRSEFNFTQLSSANINYPVPQSGLLGAVAAMQAAGTVAPFSNLPSYITISQNNPDPYTVQWMFDVQRELPRGVTLDVGYVGNRGMKLQMWRYENLPDRVTGIAPAPTFTTFTLSAPIDSAVYHALQVSVTKRYEHGLTWKVNFTHGYDNAYCSGDITGRCEPQDNNNIAAGWGPTPWDMPNMFNSDFVYQLPFQHWTGWNSGVAHALIGGWQVSGIFTARDGTPFSVGNPGSVYPADRADAVAGADPYFGNYHSTLDFLNPAAFAKVPISAASGASIRGGTSKRAGYWLPGMWNLDGSVQKSFALTERVHLQLHLDMFNLFNHTNLGGLATSLNAINFGYLTSAISRSMQLGGRLEF